MDQCFTKKGVTCVYNGHVVYTQFYTCQSNPPISQFNSPCNDFIECLVNVCIQYQSFVSILLNY